MEVQLGKNKKSNEDIIDDINEEPVVSKTSSGRILPDQDKSKLKTSEESLYKECIKCNHGHAVAVIDIIDLLRSTKLFSVYGVDANTLEDLRMKTLVYLEKLVRESRKFKANGAKMRNIILSLWKQAVDPKVLFDNLSIITYNMNDKIKKADAARMESIMNVDATDDDEDLKNLNEKFKLILTSHKNKEKNLNVTIPINDQLKASAPPYEEEERNSEIKKFMEETLDVKQQGFTSAYPDLFQEQYPHNETNAPASSNKSGNENESSALKEKIPTEKIDEKCSFCQKKIDTVNESRIALSCKHSLHLKCNAKISSSSNETSLPDCCAISIGIKEPPSKNIVIQAESPDMTERQKVEMGYMIDHGNNAFLTQALEAKFGKQGSEGLFSSFNTITPSKVEKYSALVDAQALPKETKLTVFQRMRLIKDTPVKMTDINKATFDYTFLWQNGKTVEQLLACGITPMEIFMVLKIKEWDQLLKLKLTKEDILSGRFDIYSVASLYQIDYYLLNKDLLITMNDLFETKPTSDQLLSLGLTATELLKYGFSLINMLNVDNISQKEWIEKLLIDKAFITELNLNGKICLKIGWNILDLIIKFNFTQEEMRELGFGKALLVNS